MSNFLSKDGDDWYVRNKYKLSEEIDLIDDQLIAIFSQYISSDSKFLEIGCGNGNRASKIAREFKCTVSGIDLSPIAISSGSRAYRNINLKQGDANNLPYESKSFDFVYLGFFLYLVNRDSYLRVLSEADRMIGDGGYLAILDFDVPINYSNTYKPSPSVKSCKMDNSKVFCSSGLYTLVAKSTFQHNGAALSVDLDERISIQIMRKENTF